MGDDPNELMSRKDIARRVKVHPKTVARWERQGKLPEATFQVGLLRRWHRSVIEFWIQRGGAGADVPPEEAKPVGGQTGTKRSLSGQRGAQQE